MDELKKTAGIAGRLDDAVQTMPKRGFMANMRHWKNEYAYQRILEILDNYWITEPDETEVVVDMHFLKANGETQDKHIVWRNPKYRKVVQ